jgi:hypothetical protein
MDFVSVVTVLGVFVALLGLATFALDRFTLPSITIRKGPWVDLTHLPNHNPIRVLHLVVYNAPANRLIRWFRRRQFAYGCEIHLTFWKHGEMTPVRGPVHGRWNATPEPLQSFLNPESKEVLPAYDISKALQNRSLSQLMPIEGGYQVAFLAKEDGQDECYIFNDETYPWEGWRKPGWDLAKGMYLVQVRLTWADRGSRETWLRLENPNQNIGQFDIELLERTPEGMKS